MNRIKQVVLASALALSVTALVVPAGAEAHGMRPHHMHHHGMMMRHMMRHHGWVHHHRHGMMHHHHHR